MRPEIDTSRLRTDLRAMVAELLPLKRALRRRWPGPMAEVQRRAHALAREITEHQILLARTRGRWHLRSAPRWLRDAGLASDLQAWQTRVADRLASSYARAASGPPISAA